MIIMVINMAMMMMSMIMIAGEERGIADFDRARIFCKLSGCRAGDIVVAIMTKIIVIIMIIVIIITIMIIVIITTIIDKLIVIQIVMTYV